jgi:O-antigen ligase
MQTEYFYRKPSSRKHSIHLSVINAFLLGLLLLINMLNNTVGTPLKIVGLISLVSLLLFSNAFFLVYVVVKLEGRIPRVITPFLVVLTVIFTIYFIRFATTPPAFRGVVVLLQLILTIIFFIFMLLLDWNDKAIKIISVSIAIFLVLVSLLVWGYNLIDKRLSNPNTIGGISYHLSFFLIIALSLSQRVPQKIFWALSIVLCLFLIISTHTRSVWIATISSLLTFYIWGFLKTNKGVFRSYLAVLFLFIGLFTYLYPQLFGSLFFKDLNHQVYMLTGENLFSGRHRLWVDLIEAVKEQPFTGYGPSASLGEVIGRELSAHNFYIQIVFQVGVLGLLLFLLIFWKIWGLLWHGRLDLQVRITGAFFVGILVYQTFEVSLTQNNLSIGLIQWVILAVGVSKSIHEKVHV